MLLRARMCSSFEKDYNIDWFKWFFWTDYRVLRNFEPQTPLLARKPADKALKSKMAASGDANQKAFHVLSRNSLHLWTNNKKNERTSVQTLFSFAFSCDFSEKARKEEMSPLSPAFSSLCKHSRLEAFKQTTNRWFVTMTRGETRSGWSSNFYSAFSHIQENENAKSGAFLVVITPVPPFLIVSFNTEAELGKIQHAFQVDSKCCCCYFYFPQFSAFQKKFFPSLFCFALFNEFSCRWWWLFCFSML